MSGPWDDFAAQPAAPVEHGPWDDFAQPQHPNTVPFRPQTKDEQGTTSLIRSALKQSTVGRVMDAFGQGFADDWGHIALGAEPKSWMRKLGWIAGPDTKNDWRSPIRSFNEAILMPLAAGADAALRAGPAAIEGAARAVPELNPIQPEDFPEGPQRIAAQNQKQRFSRDAYMLAQTLGVLTAEGPVAGKGVLRDVRSTERAALPEIDEPPPPAAPPPGPKPTDTFAEHARYAASDEGLKPQSKSAPLPETPTIDKAGNINLDRIQAPQDVKQVIRDAAEQNGGFTDARRGTISLAQTEDMAQALGMTPEALAKRNVGQAFNAEEAVAARNLVVQSATEVRSLSLKAVGGSDQDLLAFQEAWTRHQAIQEQVSGMTAEAGRALSSFRIAAGDADALKAIMDELGGRAGIEDLAKKINELDTPEKVSKFLFDAKKPGFKDMVVEYYVNNLLSGPATHASYAESNIAFALWKSLVETPVAATLGSVQHVFNPKAERVVYSEVGAGIHGLFSGAKEGIVAGVKAFRENKTGLLPGEAVSPAFLGKPKAIPGMAGEVLRTPSKVIAGLHTFNRVIGYRQHLSALAARQAAREGLKGNAFWTRVAQLKADPTEEMMAGARKEATSQTLMDKPGVLGRKLEEITNQPGMLGLASKIVFPFVRIASNIVEKGLVERTPFGFLSKEVRANLLGKNGEAARQMQAARMIAGTGTMAGVFTLAGEGLISGGGPSDSKQMSVMRATGWQPYSVRIGDTWYGYHRLGPLGLMIGAAADLHDVWHLAEGGEVEKAGAALLQATMRGVLNETWMRGLSELVQATSDPQRYGGRYVDNLAADFIPFSIGMGQTARALDPDLREARGLIDTMKSRIPGLSQTLLPRRDIWGEAIPNQGSLGPDILSAIYTSKANNDPIDRELLRLGKYPAPVQRKIAGVQLTPEQLDKYRFIKGRLLRLGFEQVINDPQWGELPDSVQWEVLKNHQASAGRQARAAMQMLYPDLVKQATEQRVREILGAKKKLDPSLGL